MLIYEKALPFIIGLLSLIGHAQAPANDDCSSAQVIIPNSPSISGTFTNATNSTAINCTSSVSYADVWYEFTAIAELAYIQLSNITPSAVLRISLFSNDCLINTAPLQCGIYPTNLIIGQVYKVRIHTASSAPENLNANFNISITAPITPLTPITVSTSQYTPEQLITDIFFDSDCVTVSNVSSSTGVDFGAMASAGYFESNESDFPLAEGIILSTGDAANSTGPNITSQGSTVPGWLGDSDLETIFPDISSWSASVLEFDFVSTATNFSFDFLFASDEYGSSGFECMFTDAFAFILTDLTDLSSPPKNLAVLPEIFPSTPVAVTTVHPANASCIAANEQFFGQYYTGASALLAPVNFNGITVPMTASAEIEPNHTYHLKIVISDDADSLIDSAVFFTAASFELPELETEPIITSNTGNFICPNQTTTLSFETNEEFSVQWFLNGNMIPDANELTVTATETGVYEVFATYDEGSNCGYTFEYTLAELNLNPEVSDYNAYSTNNTAVFDLDLKAEEILIQNGYDPNEYYVYFTHLPLPEDEQVPQQYTNTTNPETIYAQIWHGSGCHSTVSFQLHVTSIGTPVDLIMCEPAGDGFAIFDLTTNEATILNGLNPVEYTITYHLTQINAIDGISAITNPLNYTNTTPWTEVIYVRIINNANSASTVVDFNLIINSIPAFEVPFGSFCEDYVTGEITPYILDSGFTAGEYSFQWYLNGVIIEDTDQATYAATVVGYYTVEVTNIVTGCTGSDSAIVIKSGPASPIGQGYSIDGQDIIVSIEGFGEYMFQIDSGPMQQSNVFTNVASGTHNMTVYDISGYPFCAPLVISGIIVAPVAPDGETSQDFTEGETLADLEIQGENILWYDGLSSDSTMNTQETPLSATTLLVDGTTYYASQTINGIESEERLAVTVHLTMGVDEKSFNGLKYHPNPAANTLYISNNGILDTITIYNLVGQTVLSKNIDSENAELDLSALNSGMYIVKIDSGGQSKTIKIQKI